MVQSQHNGLTGVGVNIAAFWAFTIHLLTLCDLKRVHLTGTKDLLVARTKWVPAVCGTYISRERPPLINHLPGKICFPRTEKDWPLENLLEMFLISLVVEWQSVSSKIKMNAESTILNYDWDILNNDRNNSKSYGFNRIVYFTIPIIIWDWLREQLDRHFQYFVYHLFLICIDTNAPHCNFQRNSKHSGHKWIGAMMLTVIPWP